jgi:hypothetical protein
MLPQLTLNCPLPSATTPSAAGGDPQPSYLAFGSLACLGAACVALLLLLGPCAPLLLPNSWRMGPEDEPSHDPSCNSGAPASVLQPQGHPGGSRPSSDRLARAKLGDGADTALQQALLQHSGSGGGGGGRRNKRGSLPPQQLSLGRALALLGANGSSSCEGGHGHGRPGGPGGLGCPGSHEVEVLLGASSEDQHSSSFAGTYGEHYEMSPEGDVLMPLPASHRLALPSAGGLLERGAGMWAAAAAAGAQQGGGGNGGEQAQAIQCGAAVPLSRPLAIHLPPGVLLPPGAAQPAGAAEGPAPAFPAAQALLPTPPEGPNPASGQRSPGLSTGSQAPQSPGDSPALPLAAALPPPAAPEAAPGPSTPAPAALEPAASARAAEPSSPEAPAPGASTTLIAGNLHTLIAELQQQEPSNIHPNASPSTRAAAELQQGPRGPASIITRQRSHSASGAGSPQEQAAAPGEAGRGGTPGGEQRGAASDAEASELDKLCAAAAAALLEASAPLPAHSSLGFLTPGSPGGRPPLSRSGSMRGSVGQLPWLGPAAPQHPAGGGSGGAQDSGLQGGAAAAAGQQAGAGPAPLQRQRSGGLSQVLGSLPKVSPEGGSPVGRAEGHVHEFSDLQQLLQRL